MKGIILAGGLGTRLYPATRSISKQIIPVYDKPMIYYPLSVLMLAGIREILIITTVGDEKLFKELLGNGNQFGITLTYKVQDNPNGLAEAFIIGRDFIGTDNVALILGDNIFFGHGFTNMLEKASNMQFGALIFGCEVLNPDRYGIVELSKYNKAISVEEKPSFPKSNYAIPGLYFFDNQVVDIAKTITPSARGELEITDIIEKYLDDDKLAVELIGRGIVWLDMGTHDSLLEASNYVQTLQKRQGRYVACLEEIAYLKGYIDTNELKVLSEMQYASDYGRYLKQLANRKEEL